MRGRLPSMRSLMDDPAFRRYMKTIPSKHSANLTGTPWQLWVHTADGKWLTKKYASYREVWPVFTQRLRDHTQDPTITSRRVFYAPPGEWYKVKVRRNPTAANPATHKVEQRWRQTFFWDGTDTHWCGRCRRPTYWLPLHASHHALRQMPAVSEEDNFRCQVCGIRWVANPPIDQMVRIEPRLP